MILEARRNPVFRAAVSRLYACYHEVVTKSPRDLGLEGDLAATARHLFAAFGGLVLQYLAGVDVATLRDALQDILTSISARRDPSISLPTMG